MLDLSGLRPGEKRAALMEIQGGKCAMGTGWKGGCKGTLAADHDHWTGLLRGLLCGPHNRLEGRSCRPENDGFADYRANPPAGWDWMWDFPDWWRLADTVACLEHGLTVLEYVCQHADARGEEEEQAKGRVLQSARLPPLE